MGLESLTNSPSPPESSPFRRRARRWLRVVRGGAVTAWKFLAGVLLCQTLAGSVVVLGWTLRVMQRAALRHWWKQNHALDTEHDFASFARGSHRTQHLARWPNWIVRQDARRAQQKHADAGRWARAKFAIRSAGQALVVNGQIGAQSIFNVWLFTMPASVLWLFAWYDGWNNSFNKGYEQAVVGPLTGVLGVFLFIAAMFYVPLAQARQAVTGDWRRFYDFRLVWSVARRRWLACAGLAVLYAALAVPVNVLKTVPGFLPQMNLMFGDYTPEQALNFLKRYFFWSGALFFPAFVLLRWVAAKIYAAGLLDLVRSGTVLEDQLSEFEWETLHRLDLLHVRPGPVRSRFVRAAAWFASRTGRATASAALVLVWFAFVAQIFITEFLNYHPKVGWLNQPLVQLPWFRYLPPSER